MTPDELKNIRNNVALFEYPLMFLWPNRQKP